MYPRVFRMQQSLASPHRQCGVRAGNQRYSNWAVIAPEIRPQCRRSYGWRWFASVVVPEDQHRFGLVRGRRFYSVAAEDPLADPAFLIRAE